MYNVYGMTQLNSDEVSRVSYTGLNWSKCKASDNDEDDDDAVTDDTNAFETFTTEIEDDDDDSAFKVTAIITVNVIILVGAVVNM